MENNTMAVASSSLPIAIPAALMEQIAINIQKRELYVDIAASGNPLLLTWVDRLRKQDFNLKVIPRERDEVANLRMDGYRIFQSPHEDDDLQVRNYALEVIETAAKYIASDIHIMIRSAFTEIQIVVDGDLRVLEKIAKEDGEALVRALYGLAEARDSGYNPGDFQAAQIALDGLPAGIGITSIRIQRGPCYPQEGQFMTLRLQYRGGQKRQLGLPRLSYPRAPDGVFNLEKDGFTKSQIAKIEILMNTPSGIVITSGPTGSGKTKLLNEILKQLARIKPYKRQVTAEDPVEHYMEWAVQMSISNTRGDDETGEAFAECGRTTLRIAPNIILFGELRGPSVAITAIESAVTGHQVFTSMHVDDPFLFAERLEIMDKDRLNRAVFCDPKTVRGVISQRLIKRICPHCAISITAHPERVHQHMLDALKTWGDISAVKVQGDGCEHCNHEGSIGRFAVAEVIITDEALMTDLIKFGSSVARQHYRARPNVDPSMLELAMMHVLKGHACPINVEDKVDRIEPKIKPPHLTLVKGAE
jgi:general secretion pathway protein E